MTDETPNPLPSKRPVQQPDTASTEQAKRAAEQAALAAKEAFDLLAERVDFSKITKPAHKITNVDKWPDPPPPKK